MDARRQDYVRPVQDTGKAAPGRPGRLLRALRFLVMAVLPLVILAGALAGFAYLRATRPAVPVESRGERARLVEVVSASPAAVQPTLLLYGQVVAGRSIDIRALVPGEVRRVSAQLLEGGRVAEGEMLLELDPFAYEGALTRARADLAETQARVAELEARVRQEEAAIARATEQRDIAQREDERVSQLAGTGTATARAVDEVRLRLSQAHAALETRENQLAIYRAQRAQLEAALERLGFALAQAERNLADTVLRAPFGALVSNVGAEVGKLLSANDRVATLVALDRLEARFSLSDAQYGRLAQAGELVGRPATVIWRAGDVAVARTASVRRAAPQVAGAGFDVIAGFDDASLPDVLRPGAFIEVRMADRPHADAVTLPQTALDNGAVLLVENDRLRRVPVEVLTFGEEGAVVRGPIPDGAQIVVSRLSAAADGQLVEIRR